MRTFKEIASTPEFRRNSLLKISPLHDNVFEGAIENSIIELKHKIKEAEENVEKLSEQTNGRDVSTFTEEDYALIDEECHHEANIEMFSQHLRSLNEMRIIYLFKNLEISLKAIIKIAYPDIDTKSFYRWQNLTRFLTEKGIRVSDAPGYMEAIQLRQVNNTLKHSEDPVNNIPDIPEFKTGITSETLEIFALRIKPKVELFRQELSVALANTIAQC